MKTKNIEEIKEKIAAANSVTEGLMSLTDADRMVLELAGVLTYQAEQMTGGGLWERIKDIEVYPEEGYQLIYAADIGDEYSPEALQDLAREHGGSSGEWRTIVKYDGQEVGEPVEASPFSWEDIIEIIDKIEHPTMAERINTLADDELTHAVNCGLIRVALCKHGATQYIITDTKKISRIIRRDNHRPVCASLMIEDYLAGKPDHTQERAADWSVQAWYKFEQKVLEVVPLYFSWED